MADHLNILIGVVKGPAAGQEILAEGAVITFGRDCTNTVPLSDAMVSRIHCRLVLSDDQAFYRVEDCESLSGTYVNGARVDSMRLRLGDQFKVGSSVFEIRSGVGEADSCDRVGFHSQASDQRAWVEFDPEADPVFMASLDDLVAAYGKESPQKEFVPTTGDLDFVDDVSSMASRTLDYSDYSRELLRMVVDWARAEQGVLLVLGEGKKEFSETFVSLRGIEAESADDRPAPKASARFNRRLVSHVVENRSATLATFSANPACSKGTEGEQVVECDGPVDVEAMCVPIDNDGSLHALIYLDNYLTDGRSPAASFSKGMLRVLVSIAKQAAARFEHQKYVDSLLQAAKMASVGQLTLAISHRVGNLLQRASSGSYLVDLGVSQGNQDHIAKGWEVVKRTQNRISLLATNLSLYSHAFQPFVTDVPVRSLIQQAVDNVKDVYETENLQIDNQTRNDLTLGCDEFFTGRAIENLLALALSGTQGPAGRVKQVRLTVTQEDQNVVLKFSFYHDDERFDLESLFAGNVNEVNVELGMLELLVSRKVIEGQGSIVGVSTDRSGYNVITVSFRPRQPEVALHDS